MRKLTNAHIKIFASEKLDTPIHVNEGSYTHLVALDQLLRYCSVTTDCQG